MRQNRENARWAAPAAGSPAARSARCIAGIDPVGALVAVNSLAAGARDRTVVAYVAVMVVTTTLSGTPVSIDVASPVRVCGARHARSLHDEARSTDHVRTERAARSRRRTRPWRHAGGRPDDAAGAGDAGAAPAAAVPELPDVRGDRNLALRRAGPGLVLERFVTGEHTGTHFDAPVHWITGKDLPDNRVDTLPPGKFVGSGLRDRRLRRGRPTTPTYCLTPERILAWEAEHGRIPAGAWVLLRTDWSQRTDPADYLNVGEDGPHTPGWTADCIRFLIEERDILGGGVETVGTDAGQAFGFDPPFPFHNLCTAPADSAWPASATSTSSSHRRDRHRRAPETRQRLRQPGPGDRPGGRLTGIDF